MDVLSNILFWLHLVALAAGGAASFGLPVVGSMMPSATAETRPTLFKVGQRLSTIGRAGLATLIVTGPLLVWLKYGGTDGFTWWFWAKMVLVVILLGLVIFGGINAKRIQGGDMAAAKRAPQIGMASMATLILVVLTAVFAFS